MRGASRGVTPPAGVVARSSWHLATRLQSVVPAAGGSSGVPTARRVEHHVNGKLLCRTQFRIADRPGPGNVNESADTVGRPM